MPSLVHDRPFGRTGDRLARDRQAAKPKQAGGSRVDSKSDLPHLRGPADKLIEEREIELPFDGIPRALQTAVADGINEFRVKEEGVTFLIVKVLPATEAKHAEEARPSSSRRKEKRRSP